MSAYRLVLPSARRLHYLHLNVQGGKAALPPSFLPGRKRLYGAPAPPPRRPVGGSSACLYGILKYPDCTLPPKRKDIRKDVLSFWVTPPKGGYPLRCFNAQGGEAAHLRAKCRRLRGGCASMCPAGLSFTLSFPPNFSGQVIDCLRK